MQEKTEEPTKKKLTKAKEKGDGPDYSEFKHFLLLLSFFLLLLGAFPFLKEGAQLLFIRSFRAESITEIVKPLFYPFIFLTLSFFVMQWFLCTGKKQKKGFGFSLGKLTLLSILTYFFVKQGSPLYVYLSITLLALLIFSLFDLLYQKRKWLRTMRMTKEEIKEERKETEPNRDILSYFQGKRHEK